MRWRSRMSVRQPGMQSEKARLQAKTGKKDQKQPYIDISPKKNTYSLKIKGACPDKYPDESDSK
jgi:hypothetical protein